TWADHQLKKRPDVVRAIHQDYVAAGADVISTNTFQLTRRSITSHFKDDEHMRRIGAADVATRWGDLLRAGVALATEACVGAGRPVAVAGAMTTLEWCFRPDLAPSEAEATAEYLETISVFAEAGADLLLLETVNSTSEAVAAARAAQSAGIPLWVAFVPDENGKLFTGETMADAERALAGYDPDVVLLNCAPPADVTAGLRELAPHRRGAKGVYPHVGRFFPPEWLFTDEYPPDRYLDVARDWADLGAQVLGGCCGTTPEHIALLRSELRTG
ncbi:MAG: homocysteine S-methyltransferase family protein, partial [Chloroflexi bacterium]|nr:homocysteine S-methyltransferase family protein [Chloroflexota bacterium]